MKLVLLLVRVVLPGPRGVEGSPRADAGGGSGPACESRADGA